MSVQFAGVASPSDPESDLAAVLPAAGALAAALRLLPRAGTHRPRWVVVGADHGIAASGVSARPLAATGDRLAAILDRTDPLCAVADTTGVGLRAVDLRGAENEGRPSGRIDVEDALDAEQVVAAIGRGRELADAEVDEGADLLMAGLIGVGASTPTAVLVAAITGIEPVDAVSRGSGIDDDGWIRKTAAVRDALFRARLAGTDAVTLLRVGGGADLAALTGFLAQAAVRQTPVLVAGTAATACAVLAHRLAPGADAWFVPVGPASSRAHLRLLDVLGRIVIPGPATRLGAGSAAALMVPVVNATASGLARLTGPIAPRWDERLL